MNPTKTFMRCTAQKYLAGLEMQKLKFGFERAVLTFHCRKTMELALRGLEQNKHLAIINWSIHPDGANFEGRILLMFRIDRDAFELAQKMEQEKVEDWWKRYHAADIRTKRLMACGAIQ